MARQIFEYHPTLGYRFIPGIKARVPHETGGYLIRVNNLGFRCDHQLSRARPDSSRRLLLFGDSFTAGDGVSNGQRFGDVVESRIDRLQVANFGLPGSGTDQHYLIWREYGQALEHDLVVIAVLVENIRRVVARFRYYEDAVGAKAVYAKPWYTLEQGRLELHGVPVRREPIPEAELDADQRVAVDRGGRFGRLREVVNQLGLREVAQRVTRYQPVPEYDDPDDPAWQVMRALLARWIGECNVPVVLMPVPLYQFVEGTSDPGGYQARFAELADECDATLHDPLPDLMSCDAAERRAMRFERDPHLTRQGHAALGASLVPAIERALAGKSSEKEETGP